MRDDEWVKLALCEVQEEDDTWKRCKILGWKENKNPSDRVCLWFGGTEYEGLPEGSYKLDLESGRLKDCDGDDIMLRNLQVR